MKKELLIKKNTINLYLKKLYPICRSITGDGFRQSLKILGAKIDLKIFKFKTLSKVIQKSNSLLI